MPALQHEPQLQLVNREPPIQIFPKPLLSSRPLAWKDIVVEVYRARDVNFVATHSEHIISLQLRGSNDFPQPAQATRKAALRAGNINITPAGVSRQWRYEGDVEVLILRIVPSLLEAIWVLSTVYRLARPDVLRAIEALAAIPVLEFEDHGAVVELARLGSTTAADQPDLLIGITARSAGCETTLTFDKRLAKTGLFEIV